MDTDETVRSEIYLASHRAKHGHARTIFLYTRLQQELAAYLSTRTLLDANLHLFSTHRGLRCAFSLNTLTQYFYWMFKRAGVKGASNQALAHTAYLHLAYTASQTHTKGYHLYLATNASQAHRAARSKSFYPKHLLNEQHLYPH